MKIGTKSLLFGVHQIFWHPITVGRAWRKIYGRWPTVSEWLCIAVHDLGYWGCADIDGAEGKKHPELGAALAMRLVYYYKRWACFRSKKDCIEAGLWAFNLVQGHSKSHADYIGRSTSPLYLPDKVSILFDPFWFYLLRARATGEMKEYMRNSYRNTMVYRDAAQWLHWYRGRVQGRLDYYDQYSPTSPRNFNASTGKNIAR